jgi:hypothetical protein
MCAEKWWPLNVLAGSINCIVDAWIIFMHFLSWFMNTTPPPHIDDAFIYLCKLTCMYVLLYVYHPDSHMCSLLPLYLWQHQVNLHKQWKKWFICYSCMNNENFAPVTLQPRCALYADYDMSWIPFFIYICIFFCIVFI